jgi:putative addiction module killer protein
MEAQAREIQRYIKPDGKIPFDDWFDNLRDIKAQIKINKRLNRVNLGNLGDYRALREGVFELKIDYKSLGKRKTQRLQT